MDPNANLKEQRELAARIQRQDESGDGIRQDDAVQLAELVEALDQWLTNNSALPQAWERKAHDEGSAPPAGFSRYQIEIDVPHEIDSSALLEHVQQLASDLIEQAERGEINGGEDDEEELAAALVDRVSDRVSIQRMEG